MPDLETLARTYLNAANYSVVKRGRDLLIGTRPALADTTETTLVWLPNMSAGISFASQEASYIARFQEASETYRSANQFLLAPSLEGMSTDFRSGARRWHGVHIRVPVQFFDTPYKSEDSAESTSTDLDDLQSQARLLRRVPQPYSVLNEFTSDSDALDDLFPRLVHSLSRPERDSKSIHIVVGPAGMGKSVLFASLFAALYDQFKTEKRRQVVSPRPVPLLPSYVRRAETPTLEDALASQLKSEFSQAVELPIFKWMVANGFATLMLDGLDEILGRDPDFFDFLLDLLAYPHGTVPPSVLVCVRESLFATNDDFRDFCADYTSHVRVYELSRWNRTSQRILAGFTPGVDPDEFIKGIARTPAIQDLAGIPYYCAWLIDLHKSQSLSPNVTDIDLLEQVAHALLDREYAKGFLDRALVPTGEVLGFLEELAYADWEKDQAVALGSASAPGLTPELIRELGEIMLPGDLSPDRLAALITNLTQLAFFSRSSSSREVVFSHEIVRDYLVGRYLAGVIRNRPSSLAQKLARGRIPATSVTMRVIANECRQTGIALIAQQVLLSLNDDMSFANLLQAVLMSGEIREGLPRLSLEHKSLRGIVFSSIALDGTSFRWSDLSDVQFIDCSLRGAIFDDAILRATVFRGEAQFLQDAQFGSLSRFYSVVDSTGRVLDDVEKLGRWLRTRTGHAAEIVGPCAAALQLRQIFGKFVLPDGTARRAQLDEHGVLAGRRYADPANVLQACLRYGYLVREQRRGRITRSVGGFYSEMVQFVKSQQLTRGLMEVLAEVCDVPSCTHVSSQVEAPRP